METPNWLQEAARRAEGHEWSLGRLFSRLREIEGTSLSELSVELHCGEQPLRWLSLCHVPRAERFAEDVSTIAERYGIDVARLASVIRRAAALADLATDDSIESDSQLLAARDRRIDREPEKP